MPALGDEFRAAREARHLSLSDVSEQIHIRSTYLESIENEDWSAIAAPVYVKGFLRTYARFLGLDQEDAVRRYAALVADGAPASGPAPRPMSPSPRRNAPERGSPPSPLLWIGGVVALALVAFVGWSFYQYRSQAPDAAVAVASPAAEASGAPAPAQSAGAGSKGAVLPHSLTARVKSDSWMSVAADGTTVFEGLLKAGTEKTFRGAVVTVHAGNAGGVDVVANGKDLGALGAPGAVVNRTFKLVDSAEATKAPQSAASAEPVESAEPAKSKE
jgi:cytoskeletal protein RodZ